MAKRFTQPKKGIQEMNVTINATKPDGSADSFNCSMDEYIGMMSAVYGKQVKPSSSIPKQEVKAAEPIYTPQIIPADQMVASCQTVKPYAEIEKQLAAFGLRVVETPFGPQLCNATSPSFEALRARSVYGNCDGWSGNYNRPSLMNWLGPRAQTEVMRCQMDPNRMLGWAVGIGVAGIGVGVLGALFYAAIKARATSYVD